MTIPVLVIGGEKANGDALVTQTRLVATDVTAVVLKNCGHWVMEEKPKETFEGRRNSCDTDFTPGIAFSFLSLQKMRESPY